MSTEARGYSATMERGTSFGDVVHLGSEGGDGRPRLQATIYPKYGCNLGQLTVDGKEMLHFNPQALPGDGMTGMPFLFPFHNRVSREGEQMLYRHDSKVHKLARPAIADVFGLYHGFMRVTPMVSGKPFTDEEGAHLISTLELTKEAGEQEGYPYPLSLEMRFLLHAGGLAVTMHVQNTGAESLPLGAAFHPYFDSREIDRIWLPAREALCVDGNMLPTGDKEGAKTVTGYAPGVIMPVPKGMDTGFTDFSGGSAEAKLFYECPELSELRIMTTNFPYAMLWTPEFMKGTLSFEPAQSATNGVNNGTDVTVQPGETHKSTLNLLVIPRTRKRVVESTTF